MGICSAQSADLHNLPISPVKVRNLEIIKWFRQLQCYPHNLQIRGMAMWTTQGVLKRLGDFLVGHGNDRLGVFCNSLLHEDWSFWNSGMSDRNWKGGCITNKQFRQQWDGQMKNQYKVHKKPRIVRQAVRGNINRQIAQPICRLYSLAAQTGVRQNVQTADCVGHNIILTWKTQQLSQGGVEHWCKVWIASTEGARIANRYTLAVGKRRAGSRICSTTSNGCKWGKKYVTELRLQNYKQCL